MYMCITIYMYIHIYIYIYAKIPRLFISASSLLITSALERHVRAMFAGSIVVHTRLLRGGRVLLTGILKLLRGGRVLLT